MARLRRILFLLSPILLAVVVFGYCYGYRQTRQQPIAFTAPKAEAVEVLKGVAWHQFLDSKGGDKSLTLDVYRPPGHAGQHLPAVVVVHGDGPERVIEDFKEWGQVTSWGRNIAAYGVAAVTFDHSSTEMLARPRVFADEVDALVEYLRDHGDELGIDGDRLCLFTLSSASPFALRTALRDKPPYLRCLVIFYGAMAIQAFPGDRAEQVDPAILEEFDLARYLENEPERVPPMLLAQGARDYPVLNEALDAFAQRARVLGVEVQTLTHPEGDHAFDLGNNDLESRRIIRAALEFMVAELERPESPGRSAGSEDAEEEPVDHQEPVDRSEDRPEDPPRRQ
jgi:acetyl esterase/lipase